MATRSDIAVEYNSDPKVIEVNQPSSVMVMQDLVDTLRKQEDSFQGMSFEKLLDASGKQPLGGGVNVGITVALQNIRLAFEARRTPAQTGTVTGSPAAPHAGTQIIQDSLATFQANNVARGSLVVNFTDQSVADVISVDSETQLTTQTLVNGIGNTYDVLDVYHVFNIVQCDASGGNLTAVDELQATINAILPTAFTQVVVSASSSATILPVGSGLSAAQDIKLTRIHALLDVIEGSLDHAEVMRVLLAGIAGKASGLELLTPRFRDLADSKDRITATTDTDGNRLTIVIDATP